MATTFDATLKEMGRECPEGFLTAFDRVPTAPVSVLNVDLATVTAAADIVYGLGEPLREIIHIECQSSAAAWKHADLMLSYGHRIAAASSCAREHGGKFWIRRKDRNIWPR